jgi:hypothetical protein
MDEILMDTPPEKSRSLISDIGSYFLTSPRIRTHRGFSSSEELEDYTQRIRQRVGIDVSKYAILNIHQIGINAPATFVFGELLLWDLDSPWWPNHIAPAERIGSGVDHFKIYLLGKRKSLFGIRSGFLGVHFIPLFELKALTIQDLPDPIDFDNARYLLYECSGGYPIGVFAVYVRSSIVGRDEPEQTQLFFVVGFNFYGIESWSRTHFLSRIWEGVHNRVTANILARFKQLCEWEFRQIRKGS